MIHLVVGKTGKGKTYFLTKLAQKFFVSGRDVVANFDIDREKLIKDYLHSWQFRLRWFFNKKPLNLGSFTRIFKITEIIPMRGAEIMLDECQIYLNARQWKKLPLVLQYKLQQHRHHIKRVNGKIVEMNIWGATQNVKRVDLIAREIVNDVYKMNKLGNLFLASVYDIEEIDKVKKTCYKRFWFWYSKEIAYSYDTYSEDLYPGLLEQVAPIIGVPAQQTNAVKEERP